MRVKAALWYEMPGALPTTRTFPSIKAVEEDFLAMIGCWSRFGGCKPVGMIFDYETDAELYTLETSDNGALIRHSV